MPFVIATCAAIAGYVAPSLGLSAMGFTASGRLTAVLIFSTYTNPVQIFHSLFEISFKLLLGVAAGSAAAAIQSGIGAVAAGSTFAAAQSGKNFTNNHLQTFEILF